MSTAHTMTTQDIIKSAASVARDAAEGKLDPAALESEVTAAARDLFGQVVGEGDPLFPLQIEVCRGVLAAGGLGVDELAEWLAVAKHRAQMGMPGAEGADVPAEPDSPASGPHSSIPGGPDGGG
jgi:hypothetical protein